MTAERFRAELTATCNALGYLDEDKYFKEPDCLVTLKDLIRYLKHDDDTHEVRRELGKTQILRTDLLPILKEYHQDKDLLDVVLRLLVNLTNPVLLLYKEVIPQDKDSRNYYLELLNYLEFYKQSFCDAVVWATVTKILGELLQLDWEQRQEEDRLIIERIFVLVRNVLYISVNPQSELRTDDDVSIHDQLLWALHTTGMEDLLLYIANSKNETQFCMHTLEIISLMFREQNPEQLASAGGSRALNEKEKDEQQLLLIRNKEKQQRKENTRRFSGRHSNFGGTFVVKGVKGIGDNDLVYVKPLVESQCISFDREKIPKRKPKNRQPVEDVTVTRRSTLSIRMFLKEFCIEFLSAAYNSIMATVKDNLVRTRAEANDESYYLWALKFFMEFNRLHEFDVSLVSETVSIQTFHYIHTQIDNYHEMMLAEKKQSCQWSRRIHLGVKAYHELLQTMAAMDKCQEPGVRESSKVIKGNIFYVVKYRECLLHLLSSYDETRLSKSYLKDLVETVHVFLKLLECYSSGSGHLLVQKKARKRMKRKKSKDQKINPSENTEEKSEDLWDDLSGSLSTLLQGDKEDLPTDVIPFDSTLDADVDQKPITLYEIRELLRRRKSGEAVAMLRAARDVWPEVDIFGKSDIQPEDEFMILREIFMSDIPRPQQYSDNAENESRGKDLSEEVVEQPEVEEETDPEEEELQSLKISEQEFKLLEFVRRFAASKVVQTYCKLLCRFEKNSAFTNHCIVKLLHRIVWDCKMVGLLYQASVFRTFQRILKHPSRHSDPSIKELYKFAKYVTSKFFELATENTKAFVEILFWKNTREVYEIEEGYGTYQKSNTKVLWTEEQNEELKTLFQEYKDRNEDGKDVIDHVMDHIIDDTKSRRQILAQLKVLEVIENAKDIKRINKPRTSSTKVWMEQDELELRTLFQELKNSNDDILGTLTERLSTKRSKNSIEKKLLELELITDLKELRKKRTRKPKLQSKRNSKTSAMEDEEDDCLPSFSDTSDDDDDAKTKTGTKTNDVVIPSVEETLELLGKLLDQNRSSIGWLRDELSSTAEDLDDDDDESNATPLVPVSANHYASMNDYNFKRILSAFGLNPPKNEQESFWRFPKSLTAAMLTRRSSYLAKVLDAEEDLCADDLKATLMCGENRSTAVSRNKALESLKDKRNKRKPADKSTDVVEHNLVKEPPTSLSKFIDLETSSDEDEDRIKRLEIDLESDDEAISPEIKTTANPPPVAGPNDDDETNESWQKRPRANSDPSVGVTSRKKRMRLESATDDDDGESKIKYKTVESTLSDADGSVSSSDDEEAIAEGKSVGDVVVDDDDDDAKTSDDDGDTIQKRKRKARVLESDSE